MQKYRKGVSTKGLVTGAAVIFFFFLFLLRKQFPPLSVPLWCVCACVHVHVTHKENTTECILQSEDNFVELVP